MQREGTPASDRERCIHVIKNGNRCKILAKNGEYCYRHEQKTECPICFESVEKLDKKILPCGHGFHTDCLLHWFVTADSCPVCRVKNAGDEFVRFRDLVADNLREKYKDAIESLEKDIRVLRRQNRRMAYVIDDVDE